MLLWALWFMKLKCMLSFKKKKCQVKDNDKSDENTVFIFYWQLNYCFQIEFKVSKKKYFHKRFKKMFGITSAVNCWPNQPLL